MNAAFDIATATECPKCGLQAKTLLHRFCTHKVCPVREALAAKKAAEPAPEVAPAKPAAISDDWQQKHNFAPEGLLTIIGNIDGPDDGQFHYTTICEEVGGRTPEEALANARLIAAAPGLFAAGNELSDATAALAPHFEKPVAEHLEKWRRLDNAQKAWSAIAKAAGQ